MPGARPRTGHSRCCLTGFSTAFWRNVTRRFSAPETRPRKLPPGAPPAPLPTPRNKPADPRPARLIESPPTMPDSLKVDIVTTRNGKQDVVTYDYQTRFDKERPMALDVLLQAQATAIPDLAFRYGCRARNCGVCTIDVNGKPRIACRARVRDGDRIEPMATLPVLADLVVRRDGIARQMKGRLASAQRTNDLNVEAPEDYHALTACIECYACLDGCPMHARNADAPAGDAASAPGDGYRWGNPFSLLKLQMLRLDPCVTDAGKAAALDHAVDLGLDACVGCPGCKCGVGIDLKGKVVKELLNAAGDRLPPDEAAADN
ncbi:MAG: hypothetical protein CMM61_11790 [Rhodospirillaceae bacterium]|nr:hypothetical protein [Rhodospirillaceae bacterium]